MSKDELLYELSITVERGSNINEIESALQDLLLDLYDIDSVEEILVKDRTPPIDEDVNEIIDLIDNIDSFDIKAAIETVSKLEDIDD